MCANSWCALKVVLVRHAEISGPGSDPPLSPQGQSRAELLASILRDAAVDAIYVSEYRRTQQTAQPCAGRFHLRPEKFGGTSAALAGAIRGRGSGTVLVVGHSNTVPEVITLLGGPKVRIGETEFDNLFVLSIDSGKTSMLHLHYGTSNSGMLNRRSPVMQVTFVKSGGFLGAARRPVKGTIQFADDRANVSSETSYQRTLAPDEAEQLRAGADPAELSKAAGQIAARTRGAADLDHYQISVKTQDGKTHDISLNTSGASNELQDVSPAVAKFLRWLAEEAQNIQAHRAGAQ